MCRTFPMGHWFPVFGHLTAGTVPRRLSVEPPAPILGSMTHTSARPPSRSRDEFLARVKELQGKPVNWTDSRTVIVCVLTKVNAPCSRQLTADDLAEALRAGEINLSQVDSFFTEIDVEAQRIFAAELGVPEEALRRTAKALAKHIREDLPLLVT